MKKVNISFRTLIKKLMIDLELDKGSQVYVNRRLECEGFTFLTKTLPLLSAAVLRSLELGYFDRPTNFSWKGASLEFCSSWLGRIFDTRTGLLLPEPDPYAIYSIRQLCDYVYKLTVPFSSKELKRAEDDYLHDEELVIGKNVDMVFVEEVRKNFNTIYPRISDATIDQLACFTARYTNGSFFESEKLRIPHYIFKKLPDSFTGTCRRSLRALSGLFRPYKSANTPIKLVDEGKCSQVLFVPKDSRGPRVISKEPLHLLRMQMAYFDFMVKSLEKYSHKRINFKSQEVNRELAYQGSLSQTSVTLDLSKASDMMSMVLCKHVFRDSPLIRYFITNVRSTHTRLPSGKVIQLNKLAGMGSGLTFPTMALLIQLCVVTAVKQRTGLPLKEIARNVYVYGDDLIIPRGWYNYAQTGLSSAGFVVNQKKCFRFSHFRESCGADFYKGVSVVPVRLKLSNSDFGTSRGFLGKKRFILSDDSVINQLYQHTRELHNSHLVNTKEYIDRELGKALGDAYRIPVSGDSPCMGVYTDPMFTSGIDTVRNRLVPTSVKRRVKDCCPYKHLGSFFNTPSASPFEERDFSQFGVLAEPRKVTIKLRSVPDIVAR